MSYLAIPSFVPNVFTSCQFCHFLAGRPGSADDQLMQLAYEIRGTRVGPPGGAPLAALMADEEYNAFPSGPPGSQAARLAARMPIGPPSDSESPPV